MIDYKINEKLEVLYDLLVDNFTEFEKELIWLIANPEKITNTNKFASLLSGLKMPTFISPLLNKLVMQKRPIHGFLIFYIPQ